MTEQHSADAINVNEATTEGLGSVATLCRQEFEIVRYRGERDGFSAPRQLDYRINKKRGHS